MRYQFTLGIGLRVCAWVDAKYGQVIITSVTTTKKAEMNLLEEMTWDEAIDLRKEVTQLIIAVETAEWEQLIEFKNYQEN